MDTAKAEIAEILLKEGASTAVGDFKVSNKIPIV